jgi:hypothetical protein
MGVVTDRFGNPTNMRTDEDAAAWRAKYGPYREYPGPGWDKPKPPVADKTAEPPTVQSFKSSDKRLESAGLGKNGEAAGPQELGSRDVPVSVLTDSGQTLSKADQDWRVRISLSESSSLFYKSDQPGILASLRDTNGVIFPYTPTINVTHTARYAEQKLTHANYASYFYEGSEVSAISIQGEFTVQTAEEGKYLLAAISFFRSCTKMFFGNQDSQALAGSPPPMVFLNGFGKYYFPNVPCVVTSFQHTMPPDVDYLEVTFYPGEMQSGKPVKSGGQYKTDSDLINAAATRVPTSSSISLTVQPVYSRKFVHENFNLTKFANGELLLGKGGFI